MKALRLRLAISFMVLLVVLAYALPNLPFIGNSPLGALMEDRINLGLDLKGGMNLTLGVDMDKALQNTLSVTGQDVRDRATQEKITIMKPRLCLALDLLATRWWQVPFLLFYDPVWHP